MSIKVISSPYAVECCSEIFSDSSSLSNTGFQKLDLRYRCYANPLDREWNGSVISEPPEVYLVVTGDRLCFLACSSLLLHAAPGSQVGDFVQGLWDYEVIELFVGLVNSQAYLEVNLALNGAWWLSLFNSYRVPAAPELLGELERTSTRSLLDLVKVRAGVLSNCWWSGISMRCDKFLTKNRDAPELDIKTCIEKNDLQLNITAIVNRPHRRYLSYHLPVQNSKPDFHLPSLRDACLLVTDRQAE